MTSTTIIQEEPTTETRRSGRELILATKTYAQESPVRSWWAVLSTLFLIALTYAAVLAPLPLIVRVLASVLLGLLMVRIFVIYHDHQHHSILPRSKIAQRLMEVVGMLLLAPSSVWKSSHNHHHNHNSQLHGSHIGSFPIMTREHFQASSKRDQFHYLVIRHPLTVLFGYLTTFIVAMSILPVFRSSTRHWDCLVALVLHLAIAVGLLVYGGVLALLLAMILPCSIAGAMGCYLFYAQHNFPAVKHYEKDGWTYHGAALESSSFMKMPGWMHWFTANIGYHHVHHLNAKIPFYRLPEAMRGIPELQRPAVTSLSPVEVIRCFRLKVWDPSSGRMTGLRT